jgi:hypothetical protein
MEQMMEWMLTKMDSFQEEMKINHAKMDANQAKVILARMEAKVDANLKEIKEDIKKNNQARAEAIQQKMKAKMDSHRE